MGSKKILMQYFFLEQPAWPLLFFAITADCLPIVKRLCELGADISEQVEGGTPLGFSIGTKNLQLTRMLLKHGANAHIKLTNFQETLLHIAAQVNCPETVLLLLEYALDVNAKNTLGATPLQQAVIWGSDLVISVLVNNQAIQIDESDNPDQASPLVMCIRRYSYKHQLEQVSKFNPNQCLDFNIPTLERMIISLLDHGANINSQDIHGSTTLMYASFFGFDTIVALLLSRKADASITNNAGETALSIAQENGDTQIIGLLQPKPATTSSCVMQ